MAKIPQGILGGLRGRVGSVVGAAWKGINYIRSMPLSVANPNTTLQQAQRGKFTQCVLVARLLLADLIATYWDPYARGMSGYNHFISINIDGFQTAGFRDGFDFWSARGILTGVADLVVVGADGTSVTFTWTDNSGLGDALATDEVVCVYQNPTQEYWRFNKPAATTRATESAVIADTDVVTADLIRGYLFFIRPDLSKISDSSFDPGDVA